MITKATATSAGLTIAVTAYTSGDQLGTLLTFSNGGLQTGQRYRLCGATFVDAGNVLAATDLFVFRSSVTPAADNAAFALSDADAAKCCGVLSWATADVFAGTNNKIGATPAGRWVYGDTSDGNIYGLLVTRSGNAVFTAVGDIVTTLYLEV